MAFLKSRVFHLYFAELIAIHFKYFLRSVWFFLHFIESFTQTLTRPHFVLLHFILFFSLFTIQSCSLSPRLSVFICYLFRGGSILHLCLNPGFTFDNVFNLLAPRFIHLYSRNNSSTYLAESWELNVLIYKIHIWYCLVQIVYTF